MTAEERFLSTLKHALNAYGRDIWIEKENARGTVQVWYAYNKKKELYRHKVCCGFIEKQKFEVDADGGNVL